MTNEEFLRDVCPNHTDKSQWNKSELLHILELHKEQLRLHIVSKSLPDHYAGELNTKRIKAYRLLHEQYNLEEGTVRDIFCKGADWYKEQCQKGNVC